MAAWKRAGEPPARAWRAAALITAAAGVWMAVAWEVASFGVLRQWNATPPPLVILMFTMFLIALRLAFSTVGARLARYIPLWALVGVQGFRYPLELSMHSMAEQGIMPVQMSYSGRNFDI